METDDEKKAFRKSFRYFGELRSIFPKATVMALSATCTNNVKKTSVDFSKSRKCCVYQYVSK